MTLDRALRLLGIGGAQITVVPADDQGRMDPEGLRTALSGVEVPPSSARRRAR